jgi:hypothetical protein
VETSPAVAAEAVPCDAPEIDHAHAPTHTHTTK